MADHHKLFSRNLGDRDRSSIARWCRAVRAVTDDDELHVAGIGWFTALGHTHDRQDRAQIAARLEVIDRCREKLATKCAAAPDAPGGGA